MNADEYDVDSGEEKISNKCAKSKSGKMRNVLKVKENCVKCMRACCPGFDRNCLQEHVSFISRA